jgi:hypothetical protein
LKVDTAEQRISLSLKGMGGKPEEPKEAEAAVQPVEEAKPSKKKQRPLRGGLSW